MFDLVISCDHREETSLVNFHASKERSYNDDHNIYSPLLDCHAFLSLHPTSAGPSPRSKRLDMKWRKLRLCSQMKSISEDLSSILSTYHALRIFILHLSAFFSFVVFLYLFQISHFNHHKGKNTKPKTDFEAVWTGGQGVGLVMWWLQVKALLSATHWSCSRWHRVQLLGYIIYKAPCLPPTKWLCLFIHSLIYPYCPYKAPCGGGGLVNQVFISTLIQT